MSVGAGFDIASVGYNLATRHDGVKRILAEGAISGERSDRCWWHGVHLGYGAAGVWAAVTAEAGIRATLCARRWLGGGWEDKAVVHAEAS